LGGYPVHWGGNETTKKMGGLTRRPPPGGNSFPGPGASRGGMDEGRRTGANLAAPGFSRIPPAGTVSETGAGVGPAAGRVPIKQQKKIPPPTPRPTAWQGELNGAGPACFGGGPSDYRGEEKSEGGPGKGGEKKNQKLFLPGCATKGPNYGFSRRSGSYRPHFNRGGGGPGLPFRPRGR